MRSSDWLPDQEPSSAPRRLSNCPPKEEVTEIAFKCLRNFDHTLGDVTSPAITSFGQRQPVVGPCTGLSRLGRFSMMGKKRGT